MFGGIAFMVNGNMFCGVIKDDFMARVGPDAHEDSLAKPHARPMDFVNRSMKGMVYVSPEGVAGRGLKTWVDRCLRFAGLAAAEELGLILRRIGAPEAHRRFDDAGLAAVGDRHRYAVQGFVCDQR